MFNKYYLGQYTPSLFIYMLDKCVQILYTIVNELHIGDYCLSAEFIFISSKYFHSI